jgi:molybdopterin converting factor small subunit
MRVTVKFIGALRDKTGMASLTLELAQGGTYRDALDALEPAVASKLGDDWDAQKRAFSRKTVVSLNGKSDLRDQAKVLNEGDEILVLQPLAGG